MVEKTLESTGILPKMRVSHNEIMIISQLLSAQWFLIHIIGWTSSKCVPCSWKRLIVSGI